MQAAPDGRLCLQSNVIDPACLIRIVRQTLDTMKKFILIMVIVMLVIRLPAPSTWTVSPLGEGVYQIVAPGSSDPIYPALLCVLQSSTNCITWTSVNTNTFPFAGVGHGVTNIVQATNSTMFYRVISPPPSLHPPLILPFPDW